MPVIIAATEDFGGGEHDTLTAHIGRAASELAALVVAESRPSHPPPTPRRGRLPAVGIAQLGDAYLCMAWSPNRVDAELAAGLRSAPIDRRLAADGVAHGVDVMWGWWGTLPGFALRPRRRGGGHGAGPGTAHVVPTDSLFQRQLS